MKPDIRPNTGYQKGRISGTTLAVGKNITWKKGERESNIILPIILRLLGRLSSGTKRKGDENFGEENQGLKNGGGEEYQVVGNFIHP